LAAAAIASAEPASNEDCLACHGEPGNAASFVESKAFAGSIHGKHLCTSCHQDAANLPHPEKLSPVACSACHRVETQIYMSSDHGKAVARGRKEAASCKDCHGHSHLLLNSRHPESPVNRKNLSSTCARCHEDAKRMAKVRLAERDPLGSYNHTVHGMAFAEGRLNAAVCSDCHGTHDLHGQANSLSRVNKKNIPETCGRCHQNVFIVYRESTHGQANLAGIKEAPVCTDCHGEHTIRSPKDKASSAWVGAVTKTCAGCHASERITAKFNLPTDRLKTYLDSYHGLASQRGDLKVANCASCHGFHDVLPPSDARSSIHKANLSQTCGRCHPGAGKQLATGFVHAPPAERHWTLKFAQIFYWMIIPLTLGFMLLHNALDWWRKTLDGFRKPEDHGERLTVNERWQHAILIVTFFLLAFTGFSLKYPESGWASILAPFGESLRKDLHRWTAGAFCLLGAYHLAYLAFKKRGRVVVRAMIPHPQDATVLWQQIGFSAGWRKEPPEASKTMYHYGEKIEYWSLVWGSLVMVVSGGILLFNNLSLKHFPLWLSDLATMVHLYEAVLACLAIVIWHFYAVIFDPAVYPMNWAWLTGHMRLRRHHREPQERQGGQRSQ
jgi:formate dehydrogenase gamma subunit